VSPAIQDAAVSNPAPTHVDMLSGQLQSIRYSYEEEMHLALRQNRCPNLTGVYRDLYLVWHDLCVRAGLAEEQGSAPPLPRETLLKLSTFPVIHTSPPNQPQPQNGRIGSAFSPCGTPFSPRPSYVATL